MLLKAAAAPTSGMAQETDMVHWTWRMLWLQFCTVLQGGAMRADEACVRPDASWTLCIAQLLTNIGVPAPSSVLPCVLPQEVCLLWHREILLLLRSARAARGGHARARGGHARA